MPIQHKLPYQCLCCSLSDLNIDYSFSIVKYSESEQPVITACDRQFVYITINYFY